jgi:hypothetical protein
MARRPGRRSVESSQRDHLEILRPKGYPFKLRKTKNLSPARTHKPAPPRRPVGRQPTDLFRGEGRDPFPP